MSEFVVMSANVRLSSSKDDRGTRFAWSSRRGRTYLLLRRCNPDVLLLQECEVDQETYLAGKLGMASYRYTRTNNRVIMHKPDLEVLERRSIDLGGKRATAVKLARPAEPSSSCWFVDVHLDAFDAKVRAGQLAALIMWLPSFDGPVVVGGDFNQARVSIPGYVEYLTVKGLPVKVKLLNTFHGWRSPRYQGVRIDHLFVKVPDGPDVIASDIIETYANDEADHSWLWAKVEVTP